MGFRTAAPAGNQGYNRTSDWPAAGGAGSKRDGLNYGVGGGVNLNSPIGGSSPGGWHPTVVYMFVFVIVEMIIFNVLSHVMNI